MAGADEWVDVPQVGAKPKDDGWVDVPNNQPATTSWWDRGAVRPTTLTTSDVGKVGEIGKMFGTHFEENFTTDRLGFSRENYQVVNQALQKWGVLKPDNQPDTGWRAPFYAMNNLLFQAVDSAVAAGTFPFRTLAAGYESAKATAIDLGLPKDVASLADPLMGSPHPMGIPKVAEIPRIKKILVDGGMDERAANKVANFDPAEPKGPKPSPEELGRAQAIMEDAEVKSEADPLGINEAVDLGVVGPAKVESAIADSPSEVAARAYPRDLSGAATPEDMRGSSLGHKPGEYDKRGKEWIDKIDAPEDVRDVVEKIANDHDFFPEARGGVASSAARDAVAEAAGVNPADIDGMHFATTFDNDGKVRAVIQVLRQTAKDVVSASELAVKEPSIENVAALTEAQLRHTHALEYTMGLRAESGRSLAAWKDLLRETEHSKAKVALKSGEETGAVPKGTAGIVDAAKDLQDNLRNPGKGKLGLQKLIDKAIDLVDKADNGEKIPGAPKPSPELTGLVDEARNVLKRFGADKPEKIDKVGLDRLIEQAENQVNNLLKQKAVKNPVEALPPELQELVNKAQRVVNRFGGIAKGEKAAYLLASTGRTIAEQEQLARSVAGLTPNQVAKVLEKLRTSPEATKPGWFFWLWQQGLISGLITHTGYSIVNLATVAMERVLAPTLAAAVGKVRGQDVSLMAPLHSAMSFIHALPDAVISAGQAFKTGARVPLESEMRLFERGEESPQTKASSAAYVQGPSPDWGIWKRVFNEDQLDVAAKVLGVPGRSANLQHTFFKVLSERAAASKIAYEKAAADHVPPDKFQERYEYHSANPTDDALRTSVNDAYSGAFMEKLGGKTEEWASTVKHNPVSKWFFPFQHIPWNIIRKGVEYSPFAILGPEMGGALMGKKGMPAQNLAIAKMAIGSSISGYFMHKYLAGEATADYPIDPEEQRKWKMLGTQPNSMKIGGYWVTMDRLGPLGSMAHLGASIGDIIHHYKGDAWDEDLLRVTLLASAAAVNHFGNEAGFQTIRNFMEAQRSEKGFERFWALQLGAAVPFSSFLGQNASIIDPYERQAHTIVSGLKYKIPFVREGLLPNRDPLYGEPIPNPGYHTIKRMAEITSDPVKIELDRLGIYPAAPEDRIGGVKLPPKMYDEYQAMAGTFVQRSLGGIVAQEGWQNVPKFARQEVIRGAISSARDVAKSIMQVRHKDLLRAGIEQRMDQIQGRKPTTKLQDARE